ncbi:Ig-like domain-containing protein [Piscinibacter gummiphilus]|uniref:Uncharacterized protein n=1 Tax=Piscinibacter gummiphilus TaxID=946333 RepID=A0A1W6L6W2_9BURK|nr:Ig-like domain-containing protein [Piscinibacter gummiphilus]ARN20015.1 hypothetical protein A4W93_08860 [Piscinibacter gummiphilus]ATU64685.1 hypothetical protein CPZ87_08935 [Piscinibacter gummiphilus]GLS94883.1 hypothetical protein GCM10007918_21750 [Piscinibacter gummiphilus]
MTMMTNDTRPDRHSSRVRQPDRRAGWARSSVVGATVFALVATSMPVSAAELAIDEGVVVKFGGDGRLVVRDRLLASKGVTFTSQKDDASGGPIGAAPQVPASGDWTGIRVEKSAAAFGLTGFGDLTVRYAGAANGAALTLRGVNPALQYAQFTDNAVGLRLLDGASPAITGSSFLRNGVGIEASGGSAPTVGSTQFAQNTGNAISNGTSGSTLLATGNWWGHASGPTDPVGNPAGQGDRVSSGVNYGNFLAAAPLIAPTVRLAQPAPYFETNTVALEVSCVNATEYRIAEGGAFAGVAFQPLPGGRATVNFTLSAGDGTKPVSVQFRNASGTVATGTLTGGVLVDTEAPLLAIGNPVAGSVISGPITVDATATDGSGIERVQFFLNGTLVVTRTAAPYNYSWNPASLADGVHHWRVTATDRAGRVAEQLRDVTLSRAPVVPDTEGPQLTTPTSAGVPLANGATLTRNTTFTFQATDRSGISRIELLLDGAVVGTASGTGTYSVSLDLSSVANGAHTLALRAFDSLNNSSTTSYSINVAHAVPDAPVLSAPANGSTTREAAATVTGTAKAGSAVRLHLNGQAVGTAVNAGSDGRFSSAVTLAPGANQIQATATDAWGTSALSAAVSVTLDVTVPASPSNLSALAQVQGKVKLGWTRSTDPNVTGYQLYRASVPFTSVTEGVKVHTGTLGNTISAYDDLPQQDGTWYYRVVSVNAAGTPSVPSNQAQAASDGTLPRALSIAYAPQGKVDAATGRIGQGRVNLVVTLNEPLQATPYLSIVPQGGTPIPVDLASTGPTTWAGSFLVDANTASGTANALFSARDVVGNRGTDIDAGATLRIDTEGPALSNIAISPSSPIRYDSAPTVQATFTFSKAPKAGAAPTLNYVLSGPVRSAVSVGSLTQVSPTVWTASFTLPSDAGLAQPEILSFTSRALDDLDNVSTKVIGFNRFQVYQGNLPPLAIPLGLTAKAEPGGRVRLSWQSVDEATSYQVYRQSPAQTELVALVRSGGTVHVDTTPQDGLYKYAVATVRQSNAQESVSGQSATVEVTTIANAPGAPQSLQLQLTGQGIVATWQPPLASTVATYNLYRATGTSITSIEGLTPLKTGLRQPIALDPTPSPTQGAYVVTALDAAGNESAISNSAYLNASLLPVSNLRVEQLGNELPVITWNAPNGNVAGYNVYVGPSASRIKLTPAPITARTFSDSGYTSGERLYTIATVDANGVEMPRSLLLPNVGAQIASGLPVLRGVMNQLQVQVTNTSSAVSNARVVVRLPINKDATQFKDHKSDLFSLGANETRLVPVIVGGYADLPASAQAQVGVEIAPVEGELVKVARNESVTVGDSGIVVGMATDEFTRGATGRVRLTIENTSQVDVELLTATNNGNNDSTELRFKVLDGDNNVLATQSYRQALGANVVTLTNGLTVARIGAGQSYMTDVFLVNVPASSPNSIRLKLEVDKLRYHSGQDDEVVIAGRGAEKIISLVDTAYYGEVTNVTPISSFGDQDIVITGRALDRRGNAPLPNTRLKLVLNQQGFERVFSVLTDGAGNFSHTFVPTLTDSGLYKVSAVHPDVTDRSEQRSFTINRVTVGPTPYKLDVPKNYPFSIPFTAKAGPGTAATNLRFVLDAASQPTGQIPAGVSLQLPAPVTLKERQTLNVPVRFTASNEAQPTGTIVLNVVSDESPLTPIGRATVNYVLTEARPFLTSVPSFVETGLARGGSEVETVVVENKGLQDAINLQFTLTKPDGTAAPSWVNIANAVNGTLAVGGKRNIDVAFNPPSGTAEGVYEFRLRVEGDNVPVQNLNVYASVTASGQGSVLFKASDIYTATIGKDGKLIPGLANARITLQNEDVATVTLELTTDVLGEALFQNVPAGRYKFRATANNHQEIGGRLQVKPGITLNQSVFLQYNLITVEWSVREITIQDRYEITLNATFETDVPAAVVVMRPSSINLPKMNAGDVYYGELSLTNHGLIRAEQVKQQLPRSDGFFRYEFLVDVPEILEPKQRITIPYRVVSLKGLDEASGDGAASGAGCYNYSNQTVVSCISICANGLQSVCGSMAAWFAVSNGSCGGGSSGPGGGSGGSSGPGWSWGGGYGGGSVGTPIRLPGRKCVEIPKGGVECK